jgi:hypothetical protein
MVKKEKIEKDSKEIVNVPALKKERKEENKILKVVLFFIGVFFLALVIAFVSMKSSNHPKYGGLTFNAIQEGQLQLYQTSIPTIHNGNVADYNIYLRNNPKELKKNVDFDGQIDSLDDTVINITKEFDCNGDQVIAIANLINVYAAINKKIMKDDNASCDELGRYMYLVIQPGEETRIDQFGPSCYNIQIKECEILPGTERFIIELLAKANSDIYSE